MEINRVSYEELLRIPGIGVKSAQRIVKARRTAVLDFDSLKKMGVVLKRALYFITCKGRMMYPVKVEEDAIVRNLTRDSRDKLQFSQDGMTYRQLSLFDDNRYTVNPTVVDSGKVLLGQI